MPRSWEFWISHDPNSFGAELAQVSCTLFGKPSPPLSRAACLTSSPGNVAMEFSALWLPGCALNVCLQDLRRLICRSRG